MTPAILGTERTGPDLSDAASRQPSDIWQFIHLFNPRAVVKGSVMQAYPWLFETKQSPDPGDVVVPVPQAYAPGTGKVVATQKAKDLVAYLLSLKQVPIAGTKTGAQAPPSTAGGTETGLAAQLYASHCASCHQPNGDGVPGVFPPMKGDPVANDKDPMRHIEIVLFGLQGTVIGGVNYTAPMPAHAQVLSDSEISAVINYERKSWGNNAPTVTPQDVAGIRNHHREAKE